MTTFYDTLRVSPDAEDFVIESAYRALLKRYHPDVYAGDKAEGERLSKAITEAYQTLKDPQRRADYDRALRGSGRGSGASRSKAEETPRQPRRPSGPPVPPMPVPPAAISAPPVVAPAGGVIPIFFCGLAALILVGAVGSLGGESSQPTPSPPLAAEPAQAAKLVRRPARKNNEVRSQEAPEAAPSTAAVNSDNPFGTAPLDIRPANTPDLAVAFDTALADGTAQWASGQHHGAVEAGPVTQDGLRMCRNVAYSVEGGGEDWQSRSVRICRGADGVWRAD